MTPYNSFAEEVLAAAKRMKETGSIEESIRDGMKVVFSTSARSKEKLKSLATPITIVQTPHGLVTVFAS